MLRKYGPVWVIVIFLAAAFYSALIAVDETERAVIVQLGEPVRESVEPGLHIKIPIIQNAEVFAANLQEDDYEPTELYTADKKILIVDSYARWSLAEPMAFYTTVSNREKAQALLRDIILAELRAEIGNSPLADVVSTQRAAIMDKVTERSAEAAKKLGIKVLDVRITGLTLPVENQLAVYERMRSERERQANRILAQGHEEAQKIEAQAARQSAGLLAEARRKADETKGVADAEAARIYAAGFGQAPEFYDFVRTLEVYRKSLDERSTLFLSRDDEIMGLMKGAGKAGGAGR